MQRMLIGIGLLAAAILIAASATMNYVFMTSIARTPFEGYVLGAVSVAVDILKALLAVFVASAAREGKRTFVIVGSGAFLLFTSASMIAAAGFASLNRSAVVDRNDARQQAFADVQRELRSVEMKLSTLPAHRPPTVIEEDMNALRIDVRWSTSKQCQVPSSGLQRDLCLSFTRLRSEAAIAREADRLEVRAESLRGRIAKFRADGLGPGSDPQARMLAASLGLDEGSARRLLMMLMALVVEVASGLGVYLATGHRRKIPAEIQSRSGLDEPPPPAPDAASSRIMPAAEPATVQVASPPEVVIETQPETPRSRRSRGSVGIVSGKPRGVGFRV